MATTLQPHENDIPDIKDDRDEDGPGYREPPNNLEAEMGLLGAVLENNRAYERISDFVRPEHFFDPLHGRIYDACSKLIERGQQANPTTLKHVFDTEEFESIGGQQRPQGPQFAGGVDGGRLVPIKKRSLQ